MSSLFGKITLDRITSVLETKKKRIIVTCACIKCAWTRVACRQKVTRCIILNECRSICLFSSFYLTAALHIKYLLAFFRVNGHQKKRANSRILFVLYALCDRQKQRDSKRKMKPERHRKEMEERKRQTDKETD